MNNTKTRADIHALTGIRTSDLSVDALCRTITVICKTFITPVVITGTLAGFYSDDIQEGTFFNQPPLTVTPYTRVNTAEARRGIKLKITARRNEVHGNQWNRCPVRKGKFGWRHS
jgi:hypothetical protein